jgi:hypothetical protein
VRREHALRVIFEPARTRWEIAYAICRRMAICSMRTHIGT